MQDSSHQVKVAVVTVVFGDRFNFLRQVLDACFADPRYVQVVIVDNGCHAVTEMTEYLAPYMDRVTILRQEKNIGYSGAIAKGLTAVREVDCDYVFVLDDDSVPEAGAIDHFLANARLFPPDQKFILLGNRIDVPGNKDIFTRRPLQDQYPRGTLFEVFSWRKLRNAFMLVRGVAPRTDSPFLPIVPTEGFVTGGTLLPIAVVRTVDVPDASMVIYGEDLDYAWRIRQLGYQPYACARPIIRDVDMTFPNYGDHIFGLFNPTTPAYKVYYRMRNSVRISVRHSRQPRLILVVNVIGWYVGLCLAGVYRWGLSRFYFKRARLIAVALYTGFRPKTTMPAEVVLPQ